MRAMSVILIVVAVLLLSASVSCAQQSPKCQPWIGIKSWQVTVHINGAGTRTDSSGNTASLQESDDVQFQMLIDSSSPVPCSNSLSWTIVQSPKVSMHISGSASNLLGCRRNVSYSVANVDGGGGSLAMDFEKGTYFVTFGLLGTASWTTDNYSGSCFPGSEGFYDGVGLSYDPTCQGFDLASHPALINGALPGSGVLSGSATYTCPSQALSSLGGFPLSPDTNLFSWTITWSLTPTPANLALMLTIPTYETWRPTGGRTEKEVGTFLTSNAPNVLGIRAQLMDKDTGMPSYLIPDKVTFALAQVSSEPGVAMNWPEQAAATTDPDLTFDCAFNFSPGGTSKVDSNDCLNSISFNGSPISGKQVEFSNLTDIQPVLGTVSPHDWGGWATLNVTAMVAGVPYQGSLDSAPGNADILLPQRQPKSFIADNWKNSHNIPLSTSDSDDQEDSPNGNSDYKGDGLTLYEEYRGFDVPACPGCPQLIHREGDPTKKDLFVINLDRASRPDISDGVRLFQGATGLNVCCRSLTVSQITPDRIINFNHADGPHEVDQHAILITQGLSGTNGCTSTTTFMPGPPKVVNRIFIPPFGDLINHVTNYRQHGLVVSPAMTELQSMVAHELGHASSIWHHGGEPADYHVHWYSPDGTTIKEIPKGTGESAVLTYVTTDAGFAIRVFTEGGTGTAPKQLHAGDLGLGQNVAQRFVQGAFNGTHGGDVMCIMRYDNSMNYVAQADATKRYYTGELTGTSLTNTVDGTGTNKSSRKPQSRYGSAQSSPQRGDCSTQLCINDHVTPQPRGVPGTDDPCVAEQNAAQP
jgi:hypothetical protein